MLVDIGVSFLHTPPRRVSRLYLALTCTGRGRNTRTCQRALGYVMITREGTDDLRHFRRRRTRPVDDTRHPITGALHFSKGQESSGMAVDDTPNPLRTQPHIDVPGTKYAQRVDDSIGHGRGRPDRARRGAKVDFWTIRREACYARLPVCQEGMPGLHVPTGDRFGNTDRFVVAFTLERQLHDGLHAALDVLQLAQGGMHTHPTTGWRVSS